MLKISKQLSNNLEILWQGVGGATRKRNKGKMSSNVVRKYLLWSIIIDDILQYDHTGTVQVILSLKIGKYLKLFKFET